MNSQDGEIEKPKTSQELIDDEVELIMSVLGQKGDGVPAALQALLDDKSKIKSEGNILSQILVEVILTKFGTHSLEHVQRGV